MYLAIIISKADRPIVFIILVAVGLIFMALSMALEKDHY